MVLEDLCILYRFLWYNDELYQSVESVIYLSEVGANEKLPVGGTAIRIANDIHFPTNFTTSSYHSVALVTVWRLVEV